MDFIYLAAIDVAKRAHAGQVRKYTEEPYIVHPFAVAGLVAAVTTDDSMIISALLHDVVEDSDITIETIHGIFGKSIADIVCDLTDISSIEDGNRKERKHLDLLHTAAASRKAKTVKLADLIDNTRTITAYDPDFAKVYMREKEQLLEVLADGDQTLFKIAEGLLKDFYLKKLL